MRIPPKKSLGQHFLNNQTIPKLMADAASVGSGDVVFEIGPGTGVLTAELLRRGTKVIAVEADDRAIQALRNTFSQEIQEARLELVHADMRTAPISSFGVYEHAYKVVANIPYYLSGKLFRALLETECQPSHIVFLVQKEVAERIARDKKESLLSLSVKVFGNPRYVKTVGRGNFTPQPRVDSAVISISDISHDRLRGVDARFFFELLHAGFGSKRKQLLGNLATLFPRNILQHTFEDVGVPPDIRAEDVGLATWLVLANALIVHRSSTGSTV